MRIQKGACQRKSQTAPPLPQLAQRRGHLAALQVGGDVMHFRKRVNASSPSAAAPPRSARIVVWEQLPLERIRPRTLTQPPKCQPHHVIRWQAASQAVERVATTVGEGAQGQLTCDFAGKGYVSAASISRPKISGYCGRSRWTARCRGTSMRIRMRRRTLRSRR